MGTRFSAFQWGFLQDQGFRRRVRFSLVMDLMEEFRVIIADTLTLALFNLKILQREDFQTMRPEPIDPEATEDAAPDVTADPYGLMSNLDNSGIFDVPDQRMGDAPQDLETEEGGGKPAVKLTDDAFRRVVENFERKIDPISEGIPAQRIIDMVTT